MRNQEYREIKNIVKASVARAAHETQDDLKEFDQALFRIAHRWELGRGTPENVWRGDAQQYLKDYDYLAALITLDDKNNLKWFESKLEETVFHPLPDMPQLHQAIAEALRSHETQNGGLLALPNHHFLLIRVYPFVDDKKVDGTMIAFIAIDKLFQEVNEIVVHEPVAITVYADDEELYHVGDLNPSTTFTAESAHTSMPGWRWSMSATPEMIAQHRSRLPWVVLGIGLLMTLFVTTTLYLLLHQQRDGLKVKEGKARLRAIFQNAADGITLIDGQGNIEDFNPACEMMFGYQQEEVIGKNVKILMPEPYHHEHDGYLENYKKTGERRIIGIGRDVKGRHKDGSVFDIDLRVSEVHLPNRKLYMGMFHNITERKQAEATQQRLINKLTDSNTELERFAYVASHDLREPLRIVTNFSSLLRKEYGDTLNEEAKEYVQVIHESAARMHGMVSDLLEYARIGNAEKRFIAVNMELEFQHVQENLSASIAEHRAVLTHDVLPSVMGNPVQLMRLLQNLVSNAIKFHEAGMAPQVHVSAVEKEDIWEFCVRDNGIGMAAEYTQQIFEPFRQLHGRHEYTGTGIGLAICKRIVEKHRGKIWVESSLGKGSQFYFTLPKLT